MGIKLSCMALTARGIGGDDDEQRRRGHAEARFFAFEVATRLQVRQRLVNAKLTQQRVTALLNWQHHKNTSQEQHRHGRPEGPALAGIANHLAEHVRQGRADREDRQHLQHVGERVGFSNGWAEFALKNPPPLVPSILIASWDATGPWAIT